ncbi:MAG TPA: hypothetical protein VFT74_03140, partial [Isosphaeraceae bacterium]|nr:hypothetical protein [Isosphaeraceae bacterium]
MSTPAVPYSSTNLGDWVRRIATTLNTVISGKLNVTTDVTLTANADSTTLTDARIGFDSAVIPAMPTTANAAAELGAGGLYVNTLLKGSCVIHHANNAQT